MFCYTLLTFALLSSVAGLPNLNGARIFGGTNAVQGQFPFIVGITDENKALLCNGVIINSKWILTAAHCNSYIENSEHAFVAVGSIHLRGSTLVNITQTISHKDYDWKTDQNDIGLIEIEELTFDDNVQQIEIGEVGENQTCTIMGWGSNMNHFPDILQFAETLTISGDRCKTLANEFLYDDFYYGPETLCTLADEEVGVCNGDVGGSLVCDGKLSAVISYTIGPCGNEYPDIYVSASYYTDWIQSHISGWVK